LEHGWNLDDAATFEAMSKSCQSGYRHEALFYAGDDGFMDGTLAFVRAAMEAQEPILVVVDQRKLDALREALNGAASEVLFADMAEVGDNPARIIPAWQDFVERHGGSGRRVRGVGEPISTRRAAAELAECHRHEALLNVAFADPHFWLLCPYDTEALDPAVIEEARRNHPFVSEDGVAAGSDRFPGAEALGVPFDAPLPDPPLATSCLLFDRGPLNGLRAFVAGHAEAAGLSRERAADLVLAANEVATNSIRHGGGFGAARIWRADGAIVCEVADAGRIEDPLAGRRRPRAEAIGGRGLWIANQLCELVQLRTFATGTIVRLHMRLP